ncbi:uncharacterized protein [Henckelia pumila]
MTCINWFLMSRLGHGKMLLLKKKKLIEEGKDFTDTLIILQHIPVYTLGAGSKEEYLKFDVKNTSFEVHWTERGGEVSYHGPGQSNFLNQRENRCFANTQLHLHRFSVSNGREFEYSKEEYLKFDVKNTSFEVHRTERGGEVTYHGPGQ